MLWSQNTKFMFGVFIYPCISVQWRLFLWGCSMFTSSNLNISIFLLLPWIFLILRLQNTENQLKIGLQDFHHTAGSDTVFSHIYLWGRSHWNFRNYGLNLAIYHFLKPETNKSDFRLLFELFEKVIGGATTQKY